jgi:phosphoribosyl 1,2-cyclic phosphate phosphodiesterase
MKFIICIFIDKKMYFYIAKIIINTNLKITFLGTGTSQGVPVIACNCMVCRSDNPKDKRYRSAVMIEHGENVIIIDAGPDFRSQLLREHVQRLDFILLTHGHKDHIGGLDDVRAFNYVQKRHMDIYAQKQVNLLIESEFKYAFHANKYPGVPEFILHNIENKPFVVNDINIIPVEVLHYRLPVFGYRIDDFGYITDANFIADEEKKKLKGCKVLVINALRKATHLSHFSLDEAIIIIKELQPETAYITHISHQMGLHDEVEKSLPPYIHLAYDKLRLEV